MLCYTIFVMDIDTLYNYLIKIQSIAKIGLLYSHDEYAIKNYYEIQALTIELLENLESTKLERNNYFARDIYPTPNISVRTIVYNEHNEFLMVQEKVDEGYSLPGGWADLYDSPTEAALREVKEEAGASAKIDGIVAFLCRTPFKDPISVPEYVLVFKAKFIAFTNEHDHEISDVKWVNRSALPSLSKKVSVEEVTRILDAFIANVLIFD